MQKLIVSKFGGSSMANADAMLKAAQICLTHNPKIIVVSATFGTTNQLIKLIETASIGLWDESACILKKMTLRHISLAKELNLSSLTLKNINEEIHRLTTLVRGIYLLKDCSNKAYDSIIAAGERLSSIIFADFLNAKKKEKKKSSQKAQWFDITKVLITDNNFTLATPLFSEIQKKAKHFFKSIQLENISYVTQGFVGATIDGQMTTIGRGGSDYSASILAEAIGADILEIWTDVAGIATTDPRICKHALPIDELSFKEAAELANFGAKILHPTTILPAERNDIDVFVGSTFEPTKHGTWIKKKTNNTPTIRAITKRSKQVLITVTTPKMLNTHGFLSSLFSIFDQHKISVDLITTSEISVSISIAEDVLNDKLFNDLEKIADVTVEKELSSISLIGNNINYTPNVTASIFEELKKHESINIRMICMGASHHHFCFIVDDHQADKTIKYLHASFFE